MRDTITWLAGVETSAANLYEETAMVFREDKEFSRFLSLMALEEREHEKLLQKARMALSEGMMKHASFTFDDDFRKKIEAPFARAWRLLIDRAMTKDAMANILAEAEFSEWNEVLIYTLDLLNAFDEEIQQFMSDVEQHRKRAQEYIASLPDGENILRRVGRLPLSSGKRVLIVENNRSVARMLEALVGDQFEVSIAGNGREGTSYLRQGHFDLIIAELDLPGLSGVEMFRKALEQEPAIGSRFIFFTGTDNQGALEFVKSMKALVLPKPSPVKSLCKMMNEVLGSASAPRDKSLH